jgi:Spy/CpxP family protein refolding chaperone
MKRLNANSLSSALLAVLAGASAAPAARAQHDHAQHAPYAGQQQRAVKSLSDPQLADLRAGRGMSMALPAELNGYPGPSHTLELAQPLGLTPQQRARTEALFAQMQLEARAAGAVWIDAESALYRLFSERAATPEALRAATAAAAQAQGRLRETHLRYHLAMLEVLTPEQVAAYNRLRGYR